MAGFLKLNMRRMSGERAAFAPFTRRVGFSGTRSRHWAAIPEALSYASDAEVTVTQAWLTNQAPLPLSVELPDPGAFQYSVSVALLAEAYLFAIGSNPADAYSTGLEAVGAYVWAYERCMLVELAREFYNHNANPISCGALRMVVSARPADLPRIDRLAIDLGLEPPMIAR